MLHFLLPQRIWEMEEEWNRLAPALVAVSVLLTVPLLSEIPRSVFTVKAEPTPHRTGSSYSAEGLYTQSILLWYQMLHFQALSIKIRSINKCSFQTDSPCNVINSQVINYYNSIYQFLFFFWKNYGNDTEVLHKKEGFSMCCISKDIYSQLAGGQVVESQIEAEWVGGVRASHSAVRKLCSTEKDKVWEKE